MFLNANTYDKEQSLGDLYSRYFPKVYNTCFSFVKNHDDAFDFAQDVMLKAFGNMEAFEGNSSFSTWLFSITRNHCLSMMSKKRMLCYADIRVENNLIADEFNIEELETREKKEQLETELERCIGFLPETDRLMIELKYFRKYSIKDLQKEFHLSASAVKMRLLRARQKMEQILDLRQVA